MSDPAGLTDIVISEFKLRLNKLQSQNHSRPYHTRSLRKVLEYLVSFPIPSLSSLPSFHLLLSR